MNDITKKYTNGKVTVIWKPALCQHTAICARGLAEVFHPKDHPWITPERADTDKIVEQVKKCPSGALTYVMNVEDTSGTNK
jgi:uncharacterized Fe-S cluster protein YjdI